MTIEKLLFPGSVPDRLRRLDVFVKVYYGPDKLNEGKPGPILSLTGVIGAKANGDAESCGQIDQGFAHRNPDDDDSRYYGSLLAADVFEWSSGWDADRWLDLLDVWKRWHSNGMRPECEHQRALGWTYDTHRDPETAFQGLPCPECGYRIGSAWLYEPVPDDVVEFLDALPEATKPCPWRTL